MDKMNPDIDGIFRNYAMSYFSVHASQRLQAFQFYVTLSTALIGGFLLLLKDQNHKWVAIPGFVLALLSFVFWKLDHRTKSLVKNGEEAIKFLDSQYSLDDIDGAPHPLRIFSRDDFYTRNAKTFPLIDGYFSYSRCFRWVFISFGFLGFGAAIAALIVFPAP